MRNVRINMITILFGAGASYGSDITGTPPLGNDLFDSLRVFAPESWGLISGELTKTFRTNFEDGMVDLVQRSQFAAPLQWDMAEYFFKCFAISKTNHYIHLLNMLKIKSDEIILSTLNYDTLLFQAATYLNINIDIGASHPVHDGFSVTLPHGSCILYCATVRATGNIRFTGNISSSGQVKLLNSLNEFLQEKQANRFPPVMSYYEPNKFTPSCINFIDSQRNMFNNHIINSNKIVIIGAKIHTLDKHIWAPLEKSSSEILYIGGALGKIEFDKWSGNAGRINDISLPKYFSEAINDIKLFLNI